MFISGKALVAMNRLRKRHDKKQTGKYDLPLWVMESNGKFVRRFGILWNGGCNFKTDETHKLGEILSLKLLLIGMATTVTVRGRVIKISRENSHNLITVRLENLPEETEQLILRWLKLLTDAYRDSAAA